MEIKLVTFVCSAVLFTVMLLQGEDVVFSCTVSIAAGALIYVLYIKSKQKKEKERDRNYEMDLPDLMIHIAMFTEAGLTVQDAIERAVWAGDSSNMLYKDLKIVFERVRKGVYKDFISALEGLAQERKSAVLSNFYSVIVQNLRKGSSELGDLFTMQAQLYRNERKRLAGKLADEASSLLLFPSTIVLVALILLLLAPAVMELGNV